MYPKSRYTSTRLSPCTSPCPAKTWRADGFLEVAKHLRQSGLEPVFIGGESDDLSPFAGFPALHGRPLSEVKDLLATATLFVGNDSGPAHMAAAFGVPVGWSDHTPGLALPTAAVALGADMIEKHLTLDRTLPGPDHRASLEPDEFGALVVSIRAAEAARGKGLKEPVPAELPIAAVARKSLHWTRDLESGTTVTDGDLIVLRPGTGMPPSRITRFVVPL